MDWGNRKGSSSIQGKRQQIQNPQPLCTGCGFLFVTAKMAELRGFLNLAMNPVWCPHGDSNPGLGLERATSWSPRRWGQRTGLSLRAEARSIAAGPIRGRSRNGCGHSIGFARVSSPAGRFQLLYESLNGLRRVPAVSSSLACSSARRSRTKIPLLAPIAVVMATTIGMARPSA